MNEERQNAYNQLIYSLRNCASGKELEILSAHPDLLDDGLLKTIAVAAKILAQRGDEKGANFFRKLARQLSTALANTSAATPTIAEADRLQQQGNEQYQSSQFEAALQSWQQSLTIYREIKHRQGEGDTLGNLGVAYYWLGNYEKAVECQQQSLSIAQEIKDKEGEGAAWGNLGLAYEALGNYTEAINCYQLRWAVAQNLGDDRGKGKAKGNLGCVYYLLGEYAAAIDCHQQHLIAMQNLRNRCGEGSALGNLGLVYHSQGNFNKAIDCYQKHLAITQEIKNQPAQSNVLGNIGLVYYSLGDYEKALEYQKQSLAIVQEIKDRQGEGATLGNLGSACLALKDYGEAIGYFYQSLAIAREIKDRRVEGASLNNLGIALVESGNLIEAEKTLLSGIDIWENLREQLGSHYAYKVSIFEQQSCTYSLLQEVIINQNKFEAALEIAERGRTRTLVELLASTLSSKSANPPTIHQIRQIAKIHNTTIIEYSVIYDEFKLQREGQAQASELFIWVINSTGQIAFCRVNLKPLWEQQKITLSDLVSQARESLEVPQKRRDAPKLLRQLHEILIQPIAKFLPDNPEDSVIFIPQRFLFLVPFPALLDPETGKFLIEQHTILTAPSIQVLDSTRKRRQHLKDEWASEKDEKNSDFYLVVGNPTMPFVPKIGQPPEQLEQLEGAEEQARTIAKLLNTQPIIRDQATKVNVVQRMLNVKLIHLATHGLLDDIRELGVPGAIALAPTEGVDNGFLTAGEILELSLKAELVVLSACVTGLGKITGDGVIGLSRCLFLAGVPSVIVSLWSVPDEPTQKLMTEFYGNLQRGMNKAKALRQAILTTKQKFRSPLNWAGFTLIGEAE
jgi:CHAT domain-containing protein/Flp pilus assembly protein TadD